MSKIDEILGQVLESLHSDSSLVLSATNKIPSDTDIDLTHNGGFKPGTVGVVIEGTEAQVANLVKTKYGYGLEGVRLIKGVHVGDQIVLTDLAEAKQAIEAYMAERELALVRKIRKGVGTTPWNHDDLRDYFSNVLEEIEGSFKSNERVSNE